jgi:hypothetical protein
MYRIPSQYMPLSVEEGDDKYVLVNPEQEKTPLQNLTGKDKYPTLHPI